jgi:hypothetical protein
MYKIYEQFLKTIWCSGKPNSDGYYVTKTKGETVEYDIKLFYAHRGWLCLKPNTNIQIDCTNQFDFYWKIIDGKFETNGTPKNDSWVIASDYVLDFKVCHFIDNKYMWGSVEISPKRWQYIEKYDS